MAAKLASVAKRRAGTVSWIANVEELDRVAGMGVYSLFKEYTPIRLIDRANNIMGVIKYQPANEKDQPDTLAVKSKWLCEITRAGEKETHEIEASDTCAPASTRTVKAKLAKELKSEVDRELTSEEKARFAGELEREPRSNTYHGITHLLDLAYPDEKTTAIKETKSALKETNEKSRLTFIRLARANGHEVDDNISLADVMALFAEE